jgi:hypothetical protein
MSNIEEVKNNIVDKYAPRNGCENCLGDLHEGCSDECNAEFRKARELREELSKLITKSNEKAVREFEKFLKQVDTSKMLPERKSMIMFAQSWVSIMKDAYLTQKEEE